MEIKGVSYSDKTARLIKQQDYKLKSGTIIRISRKGKYLIFYFNNPNQFIISHLGMSGSWRITDQKLDSEKGKHAHVIIETDKKILSYVDPRRFGHLYFLNKKTFDAKFCKFAIDVSETEFSAKYIKNIFANHPNKILKPFLLDQKHFSGVGNYIASEICARAKLLPTRIVGQLNLKNCSDIKSAIDIIIHGAIKGSGTTFSGGYVDAFGQKGEGVNHLVVFHQEYCQMCKEENIKTEIIKCTMATRATYYCPRCQK